MVSGTVAADAAARAHTVTVTADDGVNDAVTATFTIRITAGDTRPVWILLADSLTATRNLGRTGPGPDNSGGWPLRWARYYYAPDDPAWTIGQFYSEGSWAFGDGANTGVGCRVSASNTIYWDASLAWPSREPYLTGGAELLPSDTSVRRLDGDGNEIQRTPAGYTDDPERLWTMRFQRTQTGQTSLTVSCVNDVNYGGEIYYMPVPLPPSG